MTDREAMQQALDALEKDQYDMVPDKERVLGVITALRERLAQPETVMAEYKFQTYAAYKTPDGEMKIGVVPETRPATREEKIVRPGVYEVPVEQEPVAWLYRDSWGTLKLSQTMPPPTGAFPVYTTPPRREWVGLTEEEELMVGVAIGLTGIAIRMIEAKLREKNNV